MAGSFPNCLPPGRLCLVIPFVLPLLLLCLPELGAGYQLGLGSAVSVWLKPMTEMFFSLSDSRTMNSEAHSSWSLKFDWAFARSNAWGLLWMTVRAKDWQGSGTGRCREMRTRGKAVVGGGSGKRDRCGSMGLMERILRGFSGKQVPASLKVAGRFRPASRTGGDLPHEAVGGLNQGWVSSRRGISPNPGFALPGALTSST